MMSHTVSPRCDGFRDGGPTVGFLRGVMLMRILSAETDFVVAHDGLGRQLGSRKVRGLDPTRK